MNSISRILVRINEWLLLSIICIFLIFCPYEHKYIGKVLYWIGSFLWLLITVLKYKKYFYRNFVMPNFLNKPLLFFGITCLLALFFSQDFYHSQKIVFGRYIMYAIFFYIGLGVVKESKINVHILVSAFILSSFVFGLGGVRDYLYFLYVDKNPALYERIWSVFGRHIPYYGFPLYLTYFTPFVYFMFIFTKNKWIKAVYFINLILLFLCLIFNFSRAAWIAVNLSLLTITYLNRHKRLLSLGLITVMFLMPMLLFSFFSIKIKNRIRSVVSPNEWSFRLPLYKSAVSIFLDHPILGTGVGMFEKVLRNSKYEMPSDYPIVKKLNLHAHNVYLEIAAEMGIIGLLAFMGIFIVFFTRVLKLINKLKEEDSLKNSETVILGLSGSILAILIFAFSTTILIVGVNNSVYFWIILGMATGLISRMGLGLKEGI